MVLRKFRKLDFGDGDMVLRKFRKLDFGDGDAVLRKFRKLDFGDGDMVLRKIGKVDFGDGDMVLRKFRKLDFGDGDMVLRKFRKLDFGDGDAVLLKGENSISVTAIWFYEKSGNSVLVTVARILKNLRSARNLERLILTALRHFPKMLRCCGFLKTGEACEFMSPAVL